MALPRITPYPLPVEDELPAARPSWQLDRSRAALLIHDLQRYFVRPFPAGQAPIAPLIEHVRRIKAACRGYGVPVFYTAQPGAQPRATRGLQADFWGPGMSADSADQDIVDEVAPEAGDQVLTKWRYSAFQRTDFETQLRVAGRDQLIVTGIYAHIGCLLTAADAFMHDIEPFFVGDAVAAFTRRDHDRAIETVAGCCGCVLSTARIVEALTIDGHERTGTT